MQFQHTPFGFVLALAPGEELVRSLISFARSEDVDAAALSGLGTVGFAELGFYDLGAQAYARRVLEEPLEACSLTGNLALVDGEPFPHIHGVFGRADFTTVGGHVFQAVCSITLELVLHVSPVPIMREGTELCNLTRLRLEGAT